MSVVVVMGCMQRRQSTKATGPANGERCGRRGRRASPAIGRPFWILEVYAPWATGSIPASPADWPDHSNSISGRAKPKIHGGTRFGGKRHHEIALPLTGAFHFIPEAIANPMSAVRAPFATAHDPDKHGKRSGEMDREGMGAARWERS